MNNTTLTTEFKINALRVNQVIFDRSELVSLDCDVRINDQLFSTTLLFTFSVFNDFLRLSGEAGLQLQDAVSLKLLGSEQPPYLISLTHKPLVFTTVRLELAYLIHGDMSCMSVELVKPISIIQQAQHLKANIRDFGKVHLVKSQILFQALHDMGSLYKYYAGLKELNVSETAAREKAGLQNEKIFKLAYYAALR